MGVRAPDGRFPTVIKRDMEAYACNQIQAVQQHGVWSTTLKFDYDACSHWPIGAQSSIRYSNEKKPVSHLLRAMSRNNTSKTNPTTQKTR